MSGLISLCYVFLMLQSLLPLLTARDYALSTDLSDDDRSLASTAEDF